MQEKTWKVDEFVLTMDEMAECVTRDYARSAMNDEEFAVFCKKQEEKRREYEERVKEYSRKHYFPGCYGDALTDC